MTNNIKIELSPEELQGIIEEYYTKVLNKNVILKLHIEKGNANYWYDTGINVHMSLIVKERLGSKDIDITYTIEQKDIEEVLGELLKEKGYEVGRIDYKTDRQCSLTKVTINLIERRKNIYLTKQYYEGDK